MQEEETAPRGPRRPGLAARAVRALGAVFAFAAFLVLVAAGGAYVRLVQGPIELERFRGEISSQLSAALPGLGVEVGGVRLALDEETRIARIEVSQLVLKDETGRAFARAPKLAGSLALSDLFQGAPRLTDVTLTGITARMVRQPSGVFSFGFGGLEETDAAVGEALFRRLMADLAADDDAPAPPAAEEADERPPQSLVLADASLLYVDRMSGRVWRAPQVDMRFTAAATGVEAEAETTILGGRHGDLAIQMTGYRNPGGEIYLSARFENVAPGDLAAQLPALDWLAAFDAPVDAAMQIGIGADGDLLALSGLLEAGSGSIDFGGGQVEGLYAASLGFIYEPANGRFRVRQADMEAQHGRFEGSGFVDLTRDEAGEVVDVVAQVDVVNLAIAAPELMHAPLFYDRARLTGRVTIDPLVVEIGEARLEAGRLFVEGAGVVEIAPGDVRADVTLKGGGMTVSDLLTHWPKAAAPGAYEWMDENMQFADITDFDASLRLGGKSAPDELKFDFSFREAAGHYLRPMPPITDAVGAGQLDLKRFALSLESGVVTPPGGGPLEIGGSTFVIADLEHPDTPADIDLRVTGALPDALAIVDHQPLGFVSKLGLPLDDAAGEVVVRTQVTMPLLKALLLEDVAASAEATITDLRLSAADLGGAVTARRVSLTADTAAFTLEGGVALGGVEADVSWREVFATGERDVKLAARVTPGQLAEAGFAAPWFRDGVARVGATVGVAADGPRIALDLDLADAEIRVGEIGWLKPRGEAARLAGQVVVADDVIRVTRVALDSAALKAEGGLRLSPDGALRRFTLDRLRYRGASDLRLTGGLNEGRWNIRVEGPYLDLTRFGDLIEGGEAGRGSPVRLRVLIDEVVFRPRLKLSGADGLFFVDPDQTVRGRLSGSMDGVAPFALRVQSGPAGGELVVRTENAGELMRAAGAFEDGAGGTMQLRATIAPTEKLRVAGTLRIRDIVIHEDAKLERLLAGADLDDLREKMKKDGIGFDDVLAPFSYADGVVRVKEAVAKSAAIGVNVSGDYLIDSATLDLDGVFTPLYALNSALGGIPILGDLLTGGEGQGVFAFNFSVKGPAEDPSVSVNPLSVLTPGALRNIFNFEGREASTTLEIEEAEGVDR